VRDQLGCWHAVSCDEGVRIGGLAHESCRSRISRRSVCGRSGARVQLEHQAAKSKEPAANACVRLSKRRWRRAVGAGSCCRYSGRKSVSPDRGRSSCCSHRRPRRNGSASSRFPAGSKRSSRCVGMTPTARHTRPRLTFSATR
jgi:hypothetical protein